MTAGAVGTAGPSRLVGARGRQRGLRDAKSAVATGAMVLSFVVVLVPLGLIVGYVVSRGAGVLSGSFLTSDIPFSPRDAGGGMGPAVVGTLVITGAATVLAVPLGILGGVYLNEYGRGSRLAQVVRFLVEVMTGVPSIVMGLFVYLFVVLRFKQLNALSGALALASLMLPLVIRTTEEMLRLVPDEQREASFALGGRKARTVLGVVLPAATPGIVSGALLAVARAAGETAPLLFTIGITSTPNTDLLHGTNTALSTQIFTNAQSPFTAAQDRAWGAALVLIAIVFVFTVLARVLTAFFSRAHA